MSGIDRADVELLLATLEQVHKPNRGLMAELCRTWLAVQDAPVVKVPKAKVGYLLHLPLSHDFAGKRVRLLAENATNNSNNNQESNHG